VTGTNWRDGVVIDPARCSTFRSSRLLCRHANLDFVLGATSNHATVNIRAGQTRHALQIKRRPHVAFTRPQKDVPQPSGVSGLRDVAFDRSATRRDPIFSP
jgi:hypothetical protein